ncbi:conserved Plasmodium protein, unknown function [Plasmodium gallinaceum]|uniref:Uncharacterized protein n=1 Tax=Plasmodium gallinaceum TaxID=5849 RepID=A0A1J1H036_PLAGA|nr:conserved Plasmodium protein, unknown function [Plasmodium gallinaceum]CRG96644.1 conserved Plasmodium protein, unknown function [Plasmodium gallinaceum]
MHGKFFFSLLKIFFFFNAANLSQGNLIISNEKNEINYISINKNNINDYINVKENSFLFNISCRTSSVLNNIKGYFLNKIYPSWDLLEVFRYENVNSNDVEKMEKIIEKTWDRENKEFLLSTKKLIEKYEDDDLFILQIGLNSISSLILNKPENVIFIEENMDICKKYFLYKHNRCLLLSKGIEFYCKDKDDSSRNNDIYETLDLITKIYQSKNNKVINIIIINHKYPVALLYYLFPYLDSSTLIILMDNLNHKMKTAIFELYNFIGEAEFTKSFEKQYFNKYNMKNEKGKKNEAKEYQLDEDIYIYNKMKQSPFYIITLNPKIMLNPPENYYETFISNDYTSSYETEITRLINDIEKVLKSNEKFYNKHKIEVSNYFTIINEFEFDDDNYQLRNKLTDILISITTKFANTGGINEENYQFALLNLKKIFEIMLFYVYENSKFKAFFTPLIDFFNLYLNKNDPNYIIYQHLIYGLIKNSFEVTSYELKELLFLDILRDVSKKISKLSINEVIELVTKLNMILKKLRSREDIQHVMEYAKKYFNIDYVNYEL